MASLTSARNLHLPDVFIHAGPDVPGILSSPAYTHFPPLWAPRGDDTARFVDGRCMSAFIRGLRVFVETLGRLCLFDGADGDELLVDAKLCDFSISSIPPYTAAHTDKCRVIVNESLVNKRCAQKVRPCCTWRRDTRACRALRVCDFFHSTLFSILYR